MVFVLDVREMGGDLAIQIGLGAARPKDVKNPLEEPSEERDDSSAGIGGRSFST
jgi:hypothetical protein